MPKQLITSRWIAALKPSATGRVEYSDTVMPGLLLRVSEAGRVWVVRYRLRLSRVRRRVTLGPVEILNLAEARKRARDLLARVRLGDDPGAPARPAGLTLSEVATRYVAARGAEIAISTSTEYGRMLRAYLSPDRAPSGPVEALSRKEIRDWLDRFAEKHGPVIANRLYQLVRAACRWATREEIIDHDPAGLLRRPRRETSRERVLADAEIAALWRATEDGSHASAAVRLQLLTGQRSGEIERMRWEDIDLDARRWAIPSAARKGGHGHVVPLSDAALTILRALRPEEGAAGRVLKVDASNAIRWWAPIRERVLAGGAVPMFTRHDLRRTCATGCAALGASPHVVSRILGHRAAAGTVAVTGIYDRFDRLPEIASALQAWAIHIEALAEGRRGEVVPIRRG